MKIVVLKFGGTSVGSIKRIKIVANIITKYLKKKFKVKSFKTNLSLSDEKNYSIAYVIIEKL